MANAKSNVLSLTARQLINTVDSYGQIKAQIRELQRQADNLSDLLKEQGDGEYLGRSYRAVINTSERASLDSTIVKGFLTPAETIAATKVAIVTTCLVKEI